MAVSRLLSDDSGYAPPMAVPEPPRGQPLEARAPASAEGVRRLATAVDHWLRRAGHGEGRRYDAVLALRDAAGYVASHADAGDVALRCAADGDGVVVAVRAATDAPDGRISGRRAAGPLPLATSIADGVEIVREDGLLVVSLRLRCDRRA